MVRHEISALTLLLCRMNSTNTKWLHSTHNSTGSLTLIQYFVQVSKEMYRVFMKYTTHIQVVSCDEALLDVSSVPMEPEELAKVHILALPRCQSVSGILTKVSG